MKIRYDLTKNESIELQMLLDQLAEFDYSGISSESSKEIKERLKSMRGLLESRRRFIEESPRKVEAARKATNARIRQAKRKIENGINQLRLEGKKITMAAIAEAAGVSINTVRKYRASLPLSEKKAQES